ncbi:MAG TPA: decarboxylating NADP(+)-dependent phosphogluconate dehydrogenase [Fibrobacteraceae bacterium]|nr:decarboxylating NADP(+)-dependent phosphogluconate dehydrogenase [Fibrobacteraceae bacterium]
MNQADIAVVGLAVMGQNLILNLADHGFTVVAYNRTHSKVKAFLEGPAQGKTILGATDIPQMLSQLQTPRRVLLMVKAGPVVDELIAQIVPQMQAGDILVDGGNSHFADTARRQQELQSRGILYVGAGISGGEEGARHGPSIMPGGDQRAWAHLREILQGVSAKTSDGEPCCDWVGDGGAGHFVKMVHNGIEYGDMQLISEAWTLLRHVGHLPDHQIAQTFAQWNQGPLSSYLVEITAEILQRKEPDGTLLVDRILDAAGQKGTGKWTGINALDLGVPLTLISEAVFARSLSAMREDRVAAAQKISPKILPATICDSFSQDVHDALLAAKIISYAQGFMLMRAAAAQQGWKLDYGRIAMLWRGGCIIRSAFLDRIRDAFARDKELPSLVVDPWFQDLLAQLQPGWRRTLSNALLTGIAVPAMASALSFFDGYRNAQSGASLLQAQRDYFGAHTYERTDRPRGEFYHTDWIGSGGFAQSGSYSA